jgi:hypothetical protein
MDEFAVPLAFNPEQGQFHDAAEGFGQKETT